MVCLLNASNHLLAFLYITLKSLFLSFSTHPVFGWIQNRMLRVFHVNFKHQMWFEFCDCVVSFRCVFLCGQTNNLVTVRMEKHMQSIWVVAQPIKQCKCKQMSFEMPCLSWIMIQQSLVWSCLIQTAVSSVHLAASLWLIMTLIELSMSSCCWPEGSSMSFSFL